MAKIGFFEEAPEQKSSMRLSSFILLLFFIAYHLPFGWANAKAVVMSKPMASLSQDQLLFDVIVLLFVFVPKTAQKVIELKWGVKDAG